MNKAEREKISNRITINFVFCVIAFVLAMLIYNTLTGGHPYFLISEALLYTVIVTGILVSNILLLIRKKGEKSFIWILILSILNAGLLALAISIQKIYWWNTFYLRISRIIFFIPSTISFFIYLFNIKSCRGNKLFNFGIAAMVFGIYATFIKAYNVFDFLKASFYIIPIYFVLFATFNLIVTKFKK